MDGSDFVLIYRMLEMLYTYLDDADDRHEQSCTDIWIEVGWYCTKAPCLFCCFFLPLLPSLVLLCCVACPVCCLDLSPDPGHGPY